MKSSNKIALYLTGLLAAAPMPASYLAAAAPPAPTLPTPAATAPVPVVDPPGHTRIRAKVVAVNAEKRQLTLDVDGKFHILAMGADLTIFSEGEEAGLEKFVPNQEIELLTRPTPKGIMVVSVDLGAALDPNEPAGRRRFGYFGPNFGASHYHKGKKFTPPKKFTPKKPTRRKYSHKPKRPSDRPVVSPH